MLWIAAISSLAYAAFTAVSALAAIHLLSLVVGFGVGYWRQTTWLWSVWAGFLTLNVAIALFWADAPWGLMGNPNYLGIAIAIGLAGALAYGLWPFLPVAAVGLWYCQSRTAFIGAAVACFCTVRREYPATAWSAGLLCILAAVLVSKGEGSVWQRLGIWQMTINNLTVFGHGWGSFGDVFNAIPVKINLTGLIATGAYNDWLQLIFELGIGAIPLVVLIALCLESPNVEARTIWWTYVSMSFTYFPLWIPGVGFFVMLALGRMAATRSERKRQWHVGDLPRVIT